MNRRKPVRSHNFKSKWDFTSGNVCLIVTIYVVVIVIILSARSQYNKQLDEYFTNKNVDQPPKSTEKLPKKKATEAECIHDGVDHCAGMPNEMFVFHNKIPKSGSTTFYNVVSALASANDFDLVHMLPCFDENDPAMIQDEKYFRLNRPNFNVHQSCQHGIQRNQQLVHWIKENRNPKRKMFLIKHHVYVNFTAFDNQQQPTYINVARDPVNLFASKFFFSRYSCNGCNGERNHAKDVESIEKCIREKEPECVGDTVHQVLLEYLCGIGDKCNRHRDIRQVVETVKNNVLKHYYIVGLLEELELTLKLLEFKMPGFLTGVLDVYRGPIGQQTTYTSSTAFNYTISNEVRNYLSTGPLKHSVDVYQLIKALFWQKVRANNVR